MCHATHGAAALPMSHRVTKLVTSERLSRLDLEIHKIDHQEHIAIDGDVASH
jgi:hypothetical protein